MTCKHVSTMNTIHREILFPRISKDDDDNDHDHEHDGEIHVVAFSWRLKRGKEKELGNERERETIVRSIDRLKFALRGSYKIV